MPPVTQPGGTNPQMSEGPLRPGIVPRDIVYPFAMPAFYKFGRRQCLRSKGTLKVRPDIHVRHKISVTAAYGYNIFARF